LKTIFISSLVLITLTQISPVQADSSESTVTNIKINHGDNSQVEIAISGTGNLSTGEPKFYSNPPRLVYDFESTVLAFNNGRTFNVDVNRNNLEMVTIAQFQTNPDIVRIVFRFNDGDKTSCINAVKALTDSNNRLTFNYQPYKPSPQPKPEKPAKPEQIRDTQVEYGSINVLKHTMVNENCDHFTLEASKALFPSTAKQDSDCINLTFDNQQFAFPIEVQFKNSHSVSINGALVEKVQMFNRAAGEVLMKLRLKETVSASQVDYKLVSLGDNELRVEVTRTFETTAAPGIEDKKEESKPDTPRIKKIQKAEPVRKHDTVKTVHKATIKGIRYIPIENGERFIFDVEGEFKPEITRLNYPSRLSIQFPETSVILPKAAIDKYRMQIDGALVKEMRVFIKDDSEYPGSVIQFYYDMKPNDSLIHKLYETDTPGIYHIDVFSVIEEEHSTVPEMSEIPKRATPDIQPAQSEEISQTTDDNKLVSFKTDDQPKVVQASGTGALPEDKPAVMPQKEPLMKIPSADTEPVEPEKNQTVFSAINFPITQMFTPDTSLENVDCIPLIVIVLFNKEKNSTHLYILTSTNGKLQWQHLKT
jgi:hypothetical protein